LVTKHKVPKAYHSEILHSRFYVGALHADHQRLFLSPSHASGDHSFGDVFATGDATKNVDGDGLDIRVGAIAKILNAAVLVATVEAPPTSRKFAGEPRTSGSSSGAATASSNIEHSTHV